MSSSPRVPSLWSLAGLALAAAAGAQDAPKFVAPVQLAAGDKILGADRMYPSPMYHDVDGDGQLDIVVGDLRGHITVALGKRVDGAVTYADEHKLNDAAGKVLDFGNW